MVANRARDHTARGAEDMRVDSGSVCGYNDLCREAEMPKNPAVFQNATIG